MNSLDSFGVIRYDYGRGDIYMFDLFGEDYYYNSGSIDNNVQNGIGVYVIGHLDETKKGFVVTDAGT